MWAGNTNSLTSLSKYRLVKTNPETDFWILAKIPVETGYQDKGQVEILPGSRLTPEQNLVIQGAFGIINN